MRLARSTTCLGGFCLCMLVAAQGQSTGRNREAVAARHFVQALYDWYAPKAVLDLKEPTWELLLRVKGHVLGPKLAKALRADLKAQAKAPGEIVGIDWDPFLASQDPVSHYRVTGVRASGRTYRVGVLSDPYPNSPARASAVVEVVRSKTGWHVVNVWYGQDNLLARLAELKRERE